MTDRIEKQIDLAAPVSRVWRALTDHAEFSEWFGIQLDGPFRAGQVTRGRFVNPKYAHVDFATTVIAMEPERRFVYTWHPYPMEPGVDYSSEPPTTVEFLLEPSTRGTLLRVTESGFDRIPEHRRALAMKMNDGGWTAQIRNIERHVAGVAA
jgi:uncharacterized protein YndB with AHSA1/START domain